MRTCWARACARPVTARGLCGAHLQRWYKAGPEFDQGPLRQDHAATCAVAACGRAFERFGLCRMHADRLNAHGSATIADETIERQGGRCAICQRPARGRGVEARLQLDHDHRTGRIRGALCGACNKAIGLLDDSPELLIAASRYLAGLPVPMPPPFAQPRRVAA